MQYMGSKNRYAKEIVPIIQSYINNGGVGYKYLEPFVGGANIIDKIKCEKKIGCDINEYLIELLKYLSKCGEIPNFISKEEYELVKNNKEKYDKWYVGLIGFCGSFGAKFFNGYAGKYKNKPDHRSRDEEAINNLKKQQPNLKDITFLNKSFLDLPKEKIKGYVIYCDPPYRGTTKYKTEKFPYEEYYNWCREMSKDNIVICSEYNMPNDFKCIWQKQTTTQISSDRKANDDKNIRVEKLFMLESEL